MTTQDTLKERIAKDLPFTLKERSNLFNLLAKGTREKTRDRLYSVIRFLPSFCFENVGIFGRVIFENEEVHYCAGQSYPDEIRIVRECLIDKR